MGMKKGCNKQDISNLKSGLFQIKHLSVIDSLDKRYLLPRVNITFYFLLFL